MKPLVKCTVSLGAYPMEVEAPGWRNHDALRIELSKEVHSVPSYVPCKPPPTIHTDVQLLPVAILLDSESTYSVRTMMALPSEWQVGVKSDPVKPDVLVFDGRPPSGTTWQTVGLVILPIDYPPMESVGKQSSKQKEA